MPKKTMKRFTDEKKAAMIAKYHEVRKSGITAEKAAKKVGLHYNTILKWENQAGKPKVSKIANKTKPKKTVSIPKNRGRKPGTAVKAGNIVLVTPDGFRVEGISPSDLVRVLRELK